MSSIASARLRWLARHVGLRSYRHRHPTVYLCFLGPDTESEAVVTRMLILPDRVRTREGNAACLLFPSNPLHVFLRCTTLRTGALCRPWPRCSCSPDITALMSGSAVLREAAVLARTEHLSLWVPLSLSYSPSRCISSLWRQRLVWYQHQKCLELSMVLSERCQGGLKHKSTLPRKKVTKKQVGRLEPPVWIWTVLL